MRRLLVQIGQGESLVQFLVSGFAKSPTPDRSSGKRWAGRIISNALCSLLNNATQREKQEIFNP